MKKAILIISILLIFSSCHKMDEDMAHSAEESGTMTFNAFFSYNGTRTTLQSDGTVFWNPGDRIAVVPLLDTLIPVSMATDIAYPSSTAAFHGPCNSASDYFAIYPYSAVDKAVKVVSLYAKDWKPAVLINVPATQIAVEGSFANGAFPSIAITDSDVLEFKNICGGAKIRVSRSDVESIEFSSLGGEFIAGTATAYFGSDSLPVSYSNSGVSSVKLTAPNGGCFIPGRDYYISLLPTSLNSGFKIAFTTGNSIGTYEYKDTVTIHRSVFGRLYDLDKKAVYVDDESILSAAGTANCYIISKAGSYKFKATVKGGSMEPLDGTPVSAEVLWESFGNWETTNVGDIVNSVSFINGKVKFTATGNNGNAVIAVKDASGNILWSWHIWSCNDFDPVAMQQVYNNNAGIMMDRNLGATTTNKGDAKALGLLYQWGRKDPFLNGAFPSYSSYSDEQIASSTLSWPSPIYSNPTTGTIAYATANPTTYILNNTFNDDWYYTGSSTTDDTRWRTSGNEKGIFDPCPYGWRVPDQIWPTALGTAESWTTSSNWDSSNRGMDFGLTDKKMGTGTIWYPAAGSRGGGNGLLGNVGSDGNYWTCVPNGYTAYDFYFVFVAGMTCPTNYSCRSVGNSVRCMKDTE